MSKDDSYVAKTQAIRACVADHPGAQSQEIIEILAVEGTRVTPAHVLVVQAVERSRRVQQMAGAS